MTRLSVGDRVSDLNGSHEGKLVDIDGDTAYVLQPNGVEIEYPLAKLKPYEPPKAAEQRTLQGPHRDTLLSPEHRALLAAVPEEIATEIARRYDAHREPSRPAYAALPPSKKLDTVRIYLPSLPRQLLAQHMNLVIAMRDLAKPGR